jgi:hypothetical protein
VTVLPWTIFWSWTFIESYSRAKSAQIRADGIYKRVLDPSSGEARGPDMGELSRTLLRDYGAAEAIQEVIDQSERRDFAAMVGGGIPAALIVLFGTFIWVRNGFRKHSTK